MKKNIVFIFMLLFFLMYGTSFGEVDSCRLVVPAEENGLMGPIGNMMEVPGPAVIFSDPVIVPAFRLHFIDEKSGQPVIPYEINIAYGWKWLEYPYPEHSWGAWSGASDIVECIKPSAETLVPEFEVQPRGWYDGKYTKFPFSGKPKFTGISIGFKIGSNNYFPYAEISTKDVKKLKNKTVIIKVKPYGKCDIIIK
jgi:hypothetical protein